MKNLKPIKINGDSIANLLLPEPKFILMEFIDPNNSTYIIMRPVIKKAQEASPAPILYYQVETPKSPHICQQFQVYTTPYYLLFYQGKLIKRIKGILPFSLLLQNIENAIEHSNTIN